MYGKGEGSRVVILRWLWSYLLIGPHVWQRMLLR